MFTAVFFQVLATAGMMIITGLLAGETGAISAGIGGAVSFVPNFFFALRLHSLAGSLAASSISFFIGEFIKVAATIGLLLITIVLYPELDWLCFMAGMVVTLQASFLAFWKKF